MELEIAGTINLQSLSPLQRVFLTTDGTVTKFLTACLLEPISVVKISEEIHHEMLHGFPGFSNDRPSDIQTVLYRKTLLQTQRTKVNLIYAESLILLDHLREEVRHELMYTNYPIGELLMKHEIDISRDILHYGIELAHTLAPYFQISPQAKLITRSYSISAKKQHLILITEKISESLFQ